MQLPDKKSIYKLLGVLALGIMLLIISSLFKDMDRTSKDANLDMEDGTDYKTASKEELETRDLDSFETQIEERLENILTKMQGVGRVEVMVTTTYGKEIILAEDITSNNSSTIEEDTEGGSRKVLSYDNQNKIVMKNTNSSSSNEPIIIKEKQPEIKGVLVISQGAGDSSVKQSIIEAVQTLLGVPAHKVTVHQLQTPKNNKGE